MFLLGTQSFYVMGQDPQQALLYSRVFLLGKIGQRVKALLITMLVKKNEKNEIR